MFPASISRPLQPFGGARSSTRNAVHAASSIGHRRVLARTSRDRLLNSKDLLGLFRKKPYPSDQINVEWRR